MPRVSKRRLSKRRVSKNRQSKRYMRGGRIAFPIEYYGGSSQSYGFPESPTPGRVQLGCNNLIGPDLSVNVPGRADTVGLVTQQVGGLRKRKSSRKRHSKGKKMNRVGRNYRKTQHRKRSKNNRRK